MGKKPKERVTIPPLVLIMFENKKRGLGGKKLCQAVENIYGMHMLMVTMKIEMNQMKLTINIYRLQHYIVKLKGKG